MIRFTRKLSAVLSCLLLIMFSSTTLAQRQMEKINHGLVAVKTSSGVFVSWRVLGSEEHDVAYNIYRDNVKVNTSPIESTSNLLDAAGTTSSTYKIKTVIKGVEKELNETATVWAKNYLDVPVRKINGGYTTYEINDASVGDLDGDGEYEIIVKRLANNMDIASTDYHYLEAYKMDGTFLWAVNMGPNIYNKVEFNFLVWDLDGDGKAEVTLRTSEGFIDALGNQIGDIDKDGKTNYRYSISGVGYRQEGPDFISVLDGMTGKELDRGTYIPRVKVTDWGPSDGGHRATKCMFTVAYLDGKHPSVVIGRGIYERIAMAAWDFKAGALTQRWTFDSNTTGNGAYAQQGYHNLTQGDVDNDGKDEIVYGSMCIDDNGKGLYSTKLGHGDAQHLTDINPDRKGLEFFGCLENSEGADYRDAGTGEILYYKNIGRDMGRCGCADLTSQYPGNEMWGPSGFPFLSATGQIITNLNPPSSMDFFIWWDGELDREMLDHAWSQPVGTGTITKYKNGSNTRLLTATGTQSNNWTKGTPSLQADLFGDWREEAMWRTLNNDALRIYTTTDITTHKIYTLMHDHQYRAAIGWQQNSYNQPPHPSFFIGYDMDSIPPADMLMDGQKVFTTGKWDINSTSAWDEKSVSTIFENGDSILFDISGDNSADIELTGSLQPSDIRVISPIDFVWSGTGTIDGTASLTKAGRGKLTINTTNTFSGTTRVWDGDLFVNGSTNSKVLVKRFAYVGGKGTFNKGISLEKYGNLTVGESKGTAEKLYINGNLDIASDATLYFDLSDNVDGTIKKNDMIVIDGDLNINGSVAIDITRLNGKLSAGTYTLATVSGALNGDITKISINGIPGVPYTLKYESNKLVITVDATRLAGKVIWQGAVDTEWDLFNKLNWLNNGVADYFIGGDSVIFNDQALQTNIDIADEYAVKDFLFDATKNMTIRGGGSITGETGLTKRGSGSLNFQTNNTYTGVTKIEEGTLKILEIVNAGYPSGIGTAAASASNIVIDGGALQIANSGLMTTDRAITFGSNNGTIDISNSSANVTFASKLVGTGKLIKTGKGTLSLKTKNSFSGTVIEEGTIQLAHDDANIDGLGDQVEFIDGTLAMNDNSYSYTNNCNWNIVVAEGNTGTLKLDSRSSLTGKLTGAGTLNVYTPWIRSDLNGNWSAFTGQINITADNDGGDLRLNNNYGFTNATVNIGANVYFQNLVGGEFKIGALSGVSTSTLSPNTWGVGYNNVDATFAGSINGASNISKYGTGTWTLTGANTYTGYTNVNEGTLKVDNSSGSATGTGTVAIKSGATLTGRGKIDGKVGISLGGTCAMSLYSTLNGDVTVLGTLSGAGAINGNVSVREGGIRTGTNILNGAITVNNGGTLGGIGSVKSTITLEDGSIVAPGNEGIGRLTVYQAVVLTQHGVLEIEVNTSTGLNDQLYCNDKITMNGTLKMVDAGTAGYKVGDSFRIMSANAMLGKFIAIEPAIPGDGLSWDLSRLTSGYIGVQVSTGINDANIAGFDVYPNPGNGNFNIKLDAYNDVTLVEVTNINGDVVYTSNQLKDSRTTINLQNLASGVYMLKIQLSDSVINKKLIIE